MKRKGKFSFSRFVYNGDSELINSPMKKNMDLFIIQTMLATAFAAFTAGLFLSGYLLSLGTPDVLVRYVSVLPTVCATFLIFLSMIIEKQNGRKKIVLFTNTIGKILIVLVVFVPLIFPKSAQVPLVVFFLVLGQMMIAISAVAYNVWYSTIIPEKIKGRYFSVRQIYALILSMILPVIAGFLVDKTSDKYMGFLILFCIGGLVGLCELVSISKIDDVKVEKTEKPIKILDAFRLPLKNKEFMRYTLTVCLFYLFFYLGGSSTQIYMINYLKLDYAYMNSLSIIISLAQILVMYKFWGAIIDKLGAKFAMVFSMCFYIIDLLTWSTVSSSNYIVMLPIMYFLASIQVSGFTISVFTRRYELIPNEGRVVYDAFFSFMLGLTVIISPIIGGALVDLITGTPLETVVEFGQFRFVYLLSAVLVILLQIYQISYEQKNKGNKLFTKEKFKVVFTTLKETIGLKRR